MKKLIMFLTVFFSAFSFVTSARAFTIDYVSGTTYNTLLVDNLAATMSTMDGMTVKATFADGAEETVTWDSASGAVSVSSGWSLSLGSADADTFDSIWTLSSSIRGIVSLDLDGDLGDTVFDVITDSNDYYSPNSGNGNELQVTSANNFDLISVTYKDRVMVNSVWYGDLYKTMTLDFGSSGFIGEIKFKADTDNLDAPLDQTPEPTTFLLFGLGCLGLAGVSRKKQL